MRKIVIALLALGLVVASTAFASNVVRISQVYGGGGNANAYYKYDFVELFNNSGSPVSIGGWSLQYGSATGTVNLGACTNCLTVLPAGATIPACGYYLVQLAAGTTGGVALPVTPDFDASTTPGTNLSASTGKVGLKADAITTPCSPTTAFVDLVGFGTANCYEGTGKAPGMSNPTGIQRLLAGATDTDQNVSDFGTAPITVDTSWPFHTSASPINPDCHLGGCCLRNTTAGACLMSTLPGCNTRGGVYLGNGVVCDAGTCAVPTHNTSWGKVKTIYR